MAPPAGEAGRAGGGLPSGRDVPPSGRLAPAAPGPAPGPPGMGGRGAPGRGGPPCPIGRLPPPIMREPAPKLGGRDAPGPVAPGPVAPGPPVLLPEAGPASPAPCPGSRRGLRLNRAPGPAGPPPAEALNPGRPAPPGRIPPPGRPMPGRAPPGPGRPPPGRWNARGPSGELRGAFSLGFVFLPFLTASLIWISRPLMRLPVSVSIASWPRCGSRNSTIANPRGWPSPSSATMISSTASPNGSK